MILSPSGTWSKSIKGYSTFPHEQIQFSVTLMEPNSKGVHIAKQKYSQSILNLTDRASFYESNAQGRGCKLLH